MQLRVISPTARAVLDMPYVSLLESPIGRVPGDMLDGATLYVGGATSLRPGVESVVPFLFEPVPEVKRKR